eukprot:2960053-Rhodomonas_salina.1
MVVLLWRCSGRTWHAKQRRHGGREVCRVDLAHRRVTRRELERLPWPPPPDQVTARSRQGTSQVTRRSERGHGQVRAWSRPGHGQVTVM